MQRALEENRPRAGRMRQICTDQIRVNLSNPRHRWSIHSFRRHQQDLGRERATFLFSIRHLVYNAAIHHSRRYPIQ